MCQPSVIRSILRKRFFVTRHVRYDVYVLHEPTNSKPCVCCAQARLSRALRVDHHTDVRHPRTIGGA
eukprot:4495856-Amphidinium_carterae.1